MITISPTYLFIWKNEILWVSVWPAGVFSWAKTPLSLHFTQYMPMSPHDIGHKTDLGYPPDVRKWWDTFTPLFLSNIINHGESDVQWQINIQCIHLSALWNYFLKREGSFNMICLRKANICFKTCVKHILYLACVLCALKHMWNIYFSNGICS